MRNPNFARALKGAQNSGPPFHKILDPPLQPMYILFFHVLMYNGGKVLATVMILWMHAFVLQYYCCTIVWTRGEKGRILCDLLSSVSVDT